MKTTKYALVAVLALIVSGTVMRASEIEGIVAGTDRLLTQPGTFVVFNGMTIPMM